MRGDVSWRRTLTGLSNPQLRNLLSGRALRGAPKLLRPNRRLTEMGLALEDYGLRMKCCNHRRRW
jgi:hypothetical protein